ncbi:MAG: hypothetical protein ABI904_19840 [Chloroflexota bacterium]
MFFFELGFLGVSWLVAFRMEAGLAEEGAGLNKKMDATQIASIFLLL